MDKILSVVIPSYKEGKNLAIILPKIKQVLNNLQITSEILVIDTLTPMDDTKTICEQNQVVYKNRENGNFYGDAVRTGIKAASGEFLIFMDADGSHDPEFIKTLYENLEGFDVVIASRYIAGGNTDNSASSVLMSLAVNKIFAWGLGLPYKDISNSFKLYHTSELKKLQLSCNNFDILEEILYKLKKAKKDFQVKEVPFSFKKRIHGKTKRELLKFIYSYIVTVFKLRFGK